PGSRSARVCRNWSANPDRGAARDSGHATRGRGVYPVVSAPQDLRMHRLLAEGDFVRALARQLIGGADADDLAQDTWLAALRRPAAVARPRAGRAGGAARRASTRRRAERRRGAREDGVRGADAATAPSTAEILACEEVRQRVVAAVLALDEPFRGTVLARFY